MLGQIAQLAPRGAIACRPPEDVGATTARSDGTDEQEHGRGLAGAVGAKEAEDLATRHFEVETVERSPSAVCLC
jgi:hypothetical protein